jgi:uncharacterized protein (TIGR03000 family)
MYKQCLSVVAGLLAAAAFALSPGPATAQHHGGGGGHAGGGHAGGGTWHGGGGNWHGGGGNWHGNNWGGRGWGWGGWGVGIGIGYPWYGGYGYGGYGPGYYSSYSYSPYYYDSGSYYDTYPYYGDTSSYYSGSPMYSDMSSSYGYGAPAQSQDNSARIRVIVPPDAKVSFGDSPTQQTGPVRFFASPELTPGKDYSYDVKATWTQDGKEVTQTRHVDIRANAGFTVDFTRQQSGEQVQPPVRR